MKVAKRRSRYPNLSMPAEIQALVDADIEQQGAARQVDQQMLGQSDVPSERDRQRAAAQRMGIFMAAARAQRIEPQERVGIAHQTAHHRLDRFAHVGGRQRPPVADIIEDATGEHRLTRPVGEVYRRDAGIEHNVINGGKKPMSFIEIEYK